MDAAIQGLVPAVRADDRLTPDPAALRSMLQSLLRAHLDANPDNHYLREHAHPRCIDGHVRTFCRYARYLPDGGEVLDWGCQHAPDSCLLKAAFGDRFHLHGCDFVPPRQYAAFYEYAGLEYRQLTDTLATPYPASLFDAVIGSGVLEHVAMDYESLKEMHRILKPGGVLIITFLPNRLSAREWVRRTVWKRAFHRRLYGLGETRRLLKRSGFYPLLAARSRRYLPVPPLGLFCSTLTFVAQKVNGM